ncbi:MAG: ATP-binding cassette domain-containing protein [Puniceicoccales bacterium]|jgi:Ni2+-binding GTPase involved in maturation of urease and hydrogenase|nr:ATP-binding cassette domain-containing protein [Puniceicoccales bacterium]
MRLITVAGPPSSGKTSVILKTLEHLRGEGLRTGVVKFDCLGGGDAETFRAAGFPALTGLSSNFCPDHYFLTNIEDCAAWGHRRGLDFLVSESAGLCNRCAPHVRGHYAVCVLDNLSGVETPRKIGPMLRTADLVLVTKGDIVSQAEREVFAFRVRQSNRRARLLFVNGITGQGAWEVARVLRAEAPDDAPLTGARMRFSVPSAVCSYCLGGTLIGSEHQHGAVRKITIEEEGGDRERGARSGERGGSAKKENEIAAGGAALSPRSPLPAPRSPAPPCSPLAPEFFALHRLPPPAEHTDLRTWWDAQSWETRNDAGWDFEHLREALDAYHAANAGLAAFAAPAPRFIEIRPGRDKSGVPERHTLRLVPGEVVCVVGPTGSGKSRLLADIECLAQGDTPTGRVVLPDGEPPAPTTRFTGEGRLVAQITQNMNFVMDLAAGDFLRLHAASRLADPAAADAAVARALDAAVCMSGEPFTAGTPLTQLSGGQSRALMLADAAFLSPKPVILIDEIENAGVDRIRALEFFTGGGKIVLLSTHDPLLALSGTRRLIIRNGGVADVIEPTPAEAATRARLLALDAELTAARNQLRQGQRLEG